MGDLVCYAVLLYLTAFFATVARSASRREIIIMVPMAAASAAILGW